MLAENKSEESVVVGNIDDGEFASNPVITAIRGRKGKGRGREGRKREGEGEGEGREEGVKGRG